MKKSTWADKLVAGFLVMAFLTFFTVQALPDTFSVLEARNFQVSTPANGTSFTTLTNVSCQRVTISTVQTNGTSSVAMEVNRGSDTFGFILPANSAKTFRGITGAGQLGIRRADQSTSQVTVTFEVETGGQ